MSRFMVRSAAQVAFACILFIIVAITFGDNAQPRVMIAYNHAYSLDYTLTLLDLRTCAARNMSLLFPLPVTDGEIAFLSHYNTRMTVGMNAMTFSPRLSPNDMRILYMRDNSLYVFAITLRPNLQRIITNQLLMRFSQDTLLNHADWLNDTQVLVATSTSSEPMLFSIITLPATPDEAVSITQQQCEINDTNVITLRP